jgi:hypothetical protein
VQTAQKAPAPDKKETLMAYTGDYIPARDVIENVFRALKRQRGIAAQNLPLPSSLPFMSGACSSIFPSTLPRYVRTLFAKGG